jgi:hypothetical protein
VLLGSPCLCILYVQQWPRRTSHIKNLQSFGTHTLQRCFVPKIVVCPTKRIYTHSRLSTEHHLSSSTRKHLACPKGRAFHKVPNYPNNPKLNERKAALRRYLEPNERLESAYLTALELWMRVLTRAWRLGATLKMECPSIHSSLQNRVNAHSHPSLKEKPRTGLQLLCSCATRTPARTLLNPCAGATPNISETRGQEVLGYGGQVPPTPKVY